MYAKSWNDPQHLRVIQLGRLSLGLLAPWTLGADFLAQHSRVTFEFLVVRLGFIPEAERRSAVTLARPHGTQRPFLALAVNIVIVDLISVVLGMRVAHPPL